MQPTDPGWTVFDPDGNVVDSGPGMTLEMASSMGEEVQDGGDRSEVIDPSPMTGHPGSP